MGHLHRRSSMLMIHHVASIVVRLLPPRVAGDCLANLLEADWQVASRLREREGIFFRADVTATDN